VPNIEKYGACSKFEIIFRCYERNWHSWRRVFWVWTRLLFRMNALFPCANFVRRIADSNLYKMMPPRSQWIESHNPCVKAGLCHASGSWRIYRCKFLTAGKRLSTLIFIYFQALLISNRFQKYILICTRIHQINKRRWYFYLYLI